MGIWSGAIMNKAAMNIHLVPREHPIRRAWLGLRSQLQPLP